MANEIHQPFAAQINTTVNNYAAKCLLLEKENSELKEKINELNRAILKLKSELKKKRGFR